MMAGLFYLLLLFILIYIYKRIAADHRQSNDNHIAIKNYTARGSTTTFIQKTHGHRCYVHELTEHEYELVNTLAQHLDPSDYYIFNNITVPSNHTVTTQIDHIVVSRFGIFVIESKNYNGWIFGNKNHKQWTQCLRNKKTQFQNPILQNFAHVSALKAHLPFLTKSFYSVIVFSDKSEFKTEMPVQVMHDEGLVTYISSKKQAILSEGELLMTIGKLSMLCQTSQVTNGEHVANLQTVHSS